MCVSESFQYCLVLGRKHVPTWYWKPSEPLTVAHRALLSFPKQQHNIKDKKIHLEKDALFTNQDLKAKATEHIGG